MQPIICFGQQPNGFLPKNFFLAKLMAARRLQKDIGGKIVWFLHNSDHDPRETRTRIFSPLHPDGFVDVNFPFLNKVQRRFTPLAKKEFSDLSAVRNALHHLTNPFVLEAFDSVSSQFVSDFCVQMYKNLGLLDDIEIISSFSKEFRENADTADLSSGWFVDTKYEGELVRAQLIDGTLRLHHGGEKFTDLGPGINPEKSVLSAGRDKRFDWMQSVINCTHYIVGASEKEYLKSVEIKNKPIFVDRDSIDNSGFAFIPSEK